MKLLDSPKESNKTFSQEYHVKTFHSRNKGLKESTGGFVVFELLNLCHLST